MIGIVLACRPSRCPVSSAAPACLPSAESPSFAGSGVCAAVGVSFVPLFLGMDSTTTTRPALAVVAEGARRVVGDVSFLRSSFLRPRFLLSRPGRTPYRVVIAPPFRSQLAPISGLGWPPIRSSAYPPSGRNCTPCSQEPASPRSGSSALSVGRPPGAWRARRARRPRRCRTAGPRASPVRWPQHVGKVAGKQQAIRGGPIAAVRTPPTCPLDEVVCLKCG